MTPLRLRCQHKYLNKRRCQEWTFRGGGVCRWHYIIYTSQRWYGKIRWLTAPRLQFAASLLLLPGFRLLRRFAMTTEVVWLLLAALLIGTALCLIADSVVVLDYPLSRYAVWPKLLAAGMLLLVGVGASTAILLYARPPTADPFVRVLPISADWAEVTPRLFVAVGVLLALFVLKAFVQRILRIQLAGVNGLLIFMAAAAAYLVFKPLIFEQGALGALMTDEFWQAATGPNDKYMNGVASLVVFTLVYFVGEFMLRLRLDKEQYQTTQLLVLAVRLATIGVSLLGARFLLVWSGVSGGVAYTVLSTAISLPLCVLTTKLIIAWTLAREASPEL